MWDIGEIIRMNSRLLLFAMMDIKENYMLKDQTYWRPRNSGYIEELGPSHYMPGRKVDLLDCHSL